MVVKGKAMSGGVAVGELAGPFRRGSGAGVVVA